MRRHPAAPPSFAQRRAARRRRRRRRPAGGGWVGRWEDGSGALQRGEWEGARACAHLVGIWRRPPLLRSAGDLELQPDGSGRQRGEGERTQQRGGRRRQRRCDGGKLQPERASRRRAAEWVEEQGVGVEVGWTQPAAHVVPRERRPSLHLKCDGGVALAGDELRRGAPQQSNRRRTVRCRLERHGEALQRVGADATEGGACRLAGVALARAVGNDKAEGEGREWREAPEGQRARRRRQPRVPRTPGRVVARARSCVGWWCVVVAARRLWWLWAARRLGRRRRVRRYSALPPRRQPACGGGSTSSRRTHSCGCDRTMGARRGAPLASPAPPRRTPAATAAAAATTAAAGRGGQRRRRRRRGRRRRRRGGQRRRRWRRRRRRRRRRARRCGDDGGGGGGKEGGGAAPAASAARWRCR